MEYIVDMDGMGGGEAAPPPGERVVRCRDCAHSTLTTSMRSARCEEWSRPRDGLLTYVPLDGFCHMGEE